MSKAKRTWLIIAMSLVGIGSFIFVGALAMVDFNFSKMSTQKYETNTYEVSENFNKIAMNVHTTDIVFASSADGNCRVECFEEEKLKHSIIVRDETLVIDTVDNRKWYEHIGISLKEPKMTVYLPQKSYDSLLINTNTGDINIDRLAAEEIGLITNTGDINVNYVTTKGNMDIKTDTGNISLQDVIASDSFTINTDTGDVRFENSDAAEIHVKTSTGDVTGTLLSEKVFITKTSTGNIRVPETITGGKCEIITSTGDIEIDLQTTRQEY